MDSAVGVDPVTVLAVTADDTVAAHCRECLDAEGHFEVTTATAVGSAIEHLDATPDVDCVVSDHDLPDLDGIALLEAVRAQAPELPVVLFTDAGSESVASRAISAGVTDYVARNHHADEWDRLVTVIDDAVRYYRDHATVVDAEAQAKTLLDAARDAIVVVRDGRVEYCNQAGADLFGQHSSATATGVPISDLLSIDVRDAIADGDDGCSTADHDGQHSAPDDGQRSGSSDNPHSAPGDDPLSRDFDDLEALLAAVQAGEERLDGVDATLADADAPAVLLEVTGTRVEWLEQPAAVLVIRDVTERDATQRTLERFRRAVEAAGHAVYMTDPDGTITYVNPAFEAITGFDAAEAIGRTPALLDSGEMSDAYFEDLWETILAGEVWSEEIVNRRASGELYHGQQTIAPITDADGEISAFVAVKTDVTEQKQREEQLRHYERAIEGASDLIAAVDTDLEYLFANEAYRTFHGLEGVELRGLGLEAVLAEVIDADQKEDVLQRVQAVLHGETVQYQMTRTDATDAAKTFEIHYRRLEPLEEDEIVGVVATMRDVTAQHEREQQLVVLDRLLRHNLHNDLNVVLGYAETIAAETSGDLEYGAEQIGDSARRLLEQTDKQREIVDLLADPPSQESVDVASAVRRVVADASADHPEATLAVEAPQELLLWTVPVLERAIEELVENALVHDDGDAPTVRVSVVDADDIVEIRVADEGPGIPEAERSILDGEAEIDPLLHGSGMGLWLVDRVATRAGGSVQFETGDSAGSVVTIVLPRHEIAPRDTADG
ncbi:PAS domain S-box protein [Salinarchaeum laminariae]|uniref:PAS domain S-box protein n=1 Tax=Salinarchaeum laminariae TaxID=869888 RepID=UPI0020BEA778|nr:PAS domain S-box protein [Salinarchaeum laminariae]